MMALAASLWVFGLIQPRGFLRWPGPRDPEAASRPPIEISGPSRAPRAEKAEAFSIWFLDSGECRAKTSAFALACAFVFKAVAAPPRAPAAALASLFSRALRSSFVSLPWPISPPSRSKKASSSALIARHRFKGRRATRASLASSSGKLPPAFHIAMRSSM